MRKHLTFALLGALLAATPVLAQNGQALIDQQLEKADDIIRDKGRFTVVTTLRNSLSDDASRGDIIELPSRGDYAIVGVCDEDCSDFDLVVRNTDAEEVGSDRLDDDVPMVILRDAPAGSYQVQSEMAECSREPCLIGVRVYKLD